MSLGESGRRSRSASASLPRSAWSDLSSFTASSYYITNAKIRPYRLGTRLANVTSLRPPRTSLGVPGTQIDVLSLDEGRPVMAPIIRFESASSALALVRPPPDIVRRRSRIVRRVIALPFAAALTAAADNANHCRISLQNRAWLLWATNAFLQPSQVRLSFQRSVGAFWCSL